MSTAQRLRVLLLLVLLIVGPGATSAQLESRRERAAGQKGGERTMVIDRGFLARRQSSPYLLDGANTRYVLVADVRTPGTAFVIGAPGVTLDLNGHEVIYGDALPITVPNGGFEEGRDREVAGWSLDGAPAASLAPNTNYLFGHQVLRMTKITGPQRIVSGPIAIPTPGRSYTAAITPVGGDYRIGVELAVVDAATGERLASGRSPNVERGLSAIVTFTPRAARPVRLRVEVTPVTGRDDTLDLDEAVLSASYDYGVLASRAWSGELPGFVNLSSAAARDYQAAARVAIVRGKLTQGRGRGYGGAPVYARQLDGLSIVGVETFTAGMDASSVYAPYTTGLVTIRNSTFRERIGNVGNRMRDVATLFLLQNAGPLVVEGNRLLGSPQVGILLDSNGAGSTVVVRDNEIRQDGVVANGYGIVVSSLHDFEIARNRIIPESGRGINVDGFRLEPVRHGTIHDNYVDVREHLNREDRVRLEARALRLRNNVDSKGPHRDLRIFDNTFIATTEPGMAQKAFGVRISYENRAAAMDDAKVVLQNNTFKAIASTPDPSIRAFAFVVDGLEPRIGLRIERNVFESNDVSLALGDSESADNRDLTLASNIFRKSKDGPPRTYTAVRVGYYQEKAVKIRIVGARLEGGATLDFAWAGQGAKELEVGWFLNVSTADQAGGRLGGAAVRVCDKDGFEVFSGVTDAAGLVTAPVVATVYRRAQGDEGEVVADERGPFSVTGSLRAGAATSTIAVDHDTHLKLLLK